MAAKVGLTRWKTLVFLARRSGVSGWRAVAADGVSVLFVAADAQLPGLLRGLCFDEPPIGADPVLHAEMTAFLSRVGFPGPTESPKQ
jgi:hypothetical protein